MTQRDLVLERTNLVGVARGFGLDVRGAGSGRSVARCCFHSEKSASFTFYPGDHFHCFGCGAHGTALDLVMHFEGVGYREALRWLAAQAGIDLNEVDSDRLRVVREPRKIARTAGAKREEIPDALRAIARRRQEITEQSTGSPALIDFFMNMDDELTALADRELQLLRRAGCGG